MHRILMPEGKVGCKDFAQAPSRGFGVQADREDEKLGEVSNQKTSRNPGRSLTAQSIKFDEASKSMIGVEWNCLMLLKRSKHML